MQNNRLEDAKRALETTLKTFIGPRQRRVLRELLKGEESEGFQEIILGLAKTVATMPRPYETDGQGVKAIVHLHYFVGHCDWWITERDSSEVQLQAFGLADMGGRELGYISIADAIAAGAELDLYWIPRPLSQVK